MHDSEEFRQVQASEQALLNYLANGKEAELERSGWQGKSGAFRLYHNSFWGKIVETPMAGVLAPLKGVLGEAALGGLLRDFFGCYPPQHEHLYRCLDRFPQFISEQLEDAQPLADLCRLLLTIYWVSEGPDPVPFQGEVDPGRLCLARSCELLQSETGAMKFYLSLLAGGDAKIFVAAQVETGLIAKNHSGEILMHVIPEEILPLAEGLAIGVSLGEALLGLPSAAAPVPELVAGFTQSFHGAFELTGADVE